MEKLNDVQLFILFALEAYKKQHEISGSQTYDIFKKLGVFDFLQNSFDILHTQSIAYVVAEINEYIKNKNEVISR